MAMEPSPSMRYFSLEVAVNAVRITNLSTADSDASRVRKVGRNHPEVGAIGRLDSDSWEVSSLRLDLEAFEVVLLKQILGILSETTSMSLIHHLRLEARPRPKVAFTDRVINSDEQRVVVDHLLVVH